MQIEKSSKLIRLNDAGQLVGWAWHSLKRERVDLIIDDEWISRHEACAVLGEENAPWNERTAGFYATVPKRFRDGRPHRVLLRTSGSGEAVSGTPVEMILSGAGADNKGQIEQIEDDGRIRGWVSEHSPETSRPICRMVFDGDTAVDFQAGEFGKEPVQRNGEPTFNFFLRVPPELRRNKRILCTLLIDTPDGWVRLDEQSAVIVEPERGRVKPRRRHRLVLVDPSLMGRRGHSFSIARRLSRLAADRLIDVTVLANAAAQPDWLPWAKLVPLFERSVYTSISRSGLGSQIENLKIVAASLRDDLERYASENSFKDSLIIYPTVNHIFATAIAEFLQERKVEDGEYHGLLLMLESGLASEAPDGPRHVIDNIMAAAYQYAFTSMGAEVGGNHWGLGAISKTLTRDFQELTATRISEAPGLLGLDRPKREPKRPDEVYEIGMYLGEIKADKGFLLTPDIAERVLSHYKNIRLHVQAYCEPGRRGAVRETLAQLESLAATDERLVLYRDFLGEESYDQMFKNLDAVVLSYDPQRYAGKTSGVFWESASLGLPVVGPAPSWIAHEAKGAGLSFFGFSEQTAKSIGDAIAALAAKRPAPRAPAKDRSVGNEIGHRFLKWWEARYYDALAPVYSRISGKITAARHHVIQRASARASASDPDAFVSGWSSSTTEWSNAPVRWMGSKAVFSLPADREDALLLRIRGYGSKDRRYLRSLSVWVDDERCEGALDVQNARSWVYEALVPACRFSAAEPLIVRLEVDTDGKPATETLLIGELEATPISAENVTEFRQAGGAKWGAIEGSTEKSDGDANKSLVA